MSGDESQHDWIEETFRFEQKRSKFRLFLAQLEYDELNLIAEDVKKMLEYRARDMETEQLNTTWTIPTRSPSTYAPYKDGEVA